MGNIIETSGLNLPTGVLLKQYGADILVMGPGLDEQSYKEIRAAMPEALGSRLIGWRTLPSMRRAEL